MGWGRHYDKLWPFKTAQYYIGLIPKLDNLVPENIIDNQLIRHQFMKRIHDALHMHTIWLAGRIWG